MAGGRGYVTEGLTSLRMYDYYQTVYDLYFECIGQSPHRRLKIRFDTGPLAQGQYTVAMDLFHPSWQ